MAYEPRIESNNLDLTSILATINELPEASKGVSLDVIAVSELPATVVENQIVVITDTPAGTIYVDTDEPASPVSGDVWVQVGSSDYGVEFSETFRNGLNKARQYNNGVPRLLAGYVGISGVWEQFSMGIPAKGTPLSEWTWEQIVDLANSGEDVTEYFAVGDEKDLVVSTGETITYVIGDFYKNTISGTNRKAPFAFTPHPKCFITKRGMNDTNVYEDSWGGSKMRNTHMVTILNTFPDELKAGHAIKTVDVVTSAGNLSTSLVTTQDKLRLHSIAELALSYTNAAPGEGSAYAYYSSNSKIKTVDGIASTYWTRSPSLVKSADCCAVKNNGIADVPAAGALNGVAPCFDI